MEFMRKYIHIARAIKPKLTNEAVEILAAEYQKLRDYNSESKDICRVSFLDINSVCNFLKFIEIDSTNYGSYYGNIDPIINSTCSGSSF